MRCVAFVYDFPHLKSWHGVAHLAACRAISDLLAIGAPYVPLTEGARPGRLKARRVPSLDASTVCRSADVPYVAVPHESPECIEILSAFQADIGVILGARALPERVLASAGCPILNVHPGVLPQNRGLDAVAWAVQRGWPQGATVHRITTRLDAGPVIGMSVLDSLEPDACLIEVAARVDALQLVLLMDTVSAIVAGDRTCEGVEGRAIGAYHSRYEGPETDLANRLTAYRARYRELLGKWMHEEAELVGRLGDRFGLVGS